MNDTLVKLVPVALVSLGVLAEIYLARILLQEWRDGRRRTRSARHTKVDHSARLSPAGRRFASAFGMSALVCTGAYGQEAPAEGGAKAPTTLSATAGEEPKAEESPLKPAETKSPYSLQLNLDYTTAYFYHGIMQEDSGLILQPAAKLTINLYEQDDFKIEAYLANWNSFQGQKTGAQTSGDFTQYWYEADLLGGFTLTKGKLALSTQYVFLTSPSDAYETVQELDFTLSFDDSDVLGKLALHPYALLAIETGADASDGGNSDTGTYLELGIGPGFSFDVGKTPIAVTFPVAVGLSLHDYYQNAAGEDDTFGYFQVGAKASIPLPFGERWGKWTLNAGVYGLFLGDNTAEYNHGKDDQAVATVGLQLNF